MPEESNRLGGSSSLSSGVESESIFTVDLRDPQVLNGRAHRRSATVVPFSDHPKHQGGRKLERSDTNQYNP